MRILHLSGDYPDPICAAKTRAISNLLEISKGCDHRVYSMNRTGWTKPLTAETFSDAVSDTNVSVRYPAPPFGVLLRPFLGRLADWISRDCERARYRPELIHAHKLTIEALAANWLARVFNVPLVVSAQGNTDLKIALARPDFRPTFSRIWRNADLVFPFAPWTRDELNSLLGFRRRQIVCLPCPGPADDIIAPRIGPSVIRTAFRIDDWRNKNAARLIQAIGLAARDVRDIRLEVIGGGSNQSFAQLRHLAERHAPGLVRFLGPVPHAEMQVVLNSSAAFALVSNRESFGMVFSEALLAGVPCLIPKGQAIDGYFPDGEVTLAAASKDTDGIALSLVRLVREQVEFKCRLRRLQAAGALEFLRRASIGQRYERALNELEFRQTAEIERSPLPARRARIARSACKL